MNNITFWQMIDDARKEAGDWEEMIEPLTKSLEKLSETEIFQWQQIFDEYQRLSYKNKLWAAAYVINGGCSDDGFDYFRAWLTAQGKDAFMGSLYDPETLADIAEGDDAEFEDIMSVASAAYFSKHGIERDYDRFYNELDKYPLSDALKSEMANEIKYAPDIDVDWNEDGLKELLPKLCGAYDW
jgi:hypothetical protein